MTYDLISVVNDRDSRIVIASPSSGEWTAVQGEDIVALAAAHGLVGVEVPDGIATYHSADEVLAITDPRGDRTEFRIERDRLAVLAEYVKAKNGFAPGVEIFELRELAFEDADAAMKLVYEMQLELL